MTAAWWAFLWSDRGRWWCALWAVGRRAQSRARRTAWAQAYRRTPTGQAALRRYRESPKGRAALARHRRSERYRVTQGRLRARRYQRWVGRLLAALYRRERSPRAHAWRERGVDNLPPGLVLGDGTGALEPLRLLAAALIRNAVQVLEADPSGQGRRETAAEAREWIRGAAAPITFAACCGILGWSESATQAALAPLLDRAPVAVRWWRYGEVGGPCRPDLVKLARDRAAAARDAAARVRLGEIPAAQGRAPGPGAAGRSGRLGANGGHPGDEARA